MDKELNGLWTGFRSLLTSEDGDLDLAQLRDLWKKCCV